jgi:hypothetical protein
MNVNEIAAKLNGEMVGNRVIVNHKGKREYATGLYDDGSVFLNELGVELMQAIDAAAQKPKATTGPRRVGLKTNLDDVQIDVE